MNSSLSSASAHGSRALTPLERAQRRRLLYQDSLSLLGLTAVSICIAVLTYFFFHSFREHRSVLEKRWFARGEAALAAGQPIPAVEDFRSALSLSAANPTYELALAEALAAADRNNEAFAYFSTLHDAEPGDGFLNLQLARLAVRRNDSQQAIVDYRSALSGLWYGHGTEQRFQIRLELARYLMSLGKNTDAQGDLLTAEGNSLDRPAQLLEVAGLLRQAGDPTDAFTAFRRVEQSPASTPTQVLDSLWSEAHVAIVLGQYKRAALALDRYMVRARQHPAASTPEQHQAALGLEAKLDRLLQLIPFYALPPLPHAQRVLTAAAVAHRRYMACSAQVADRTASGQNISGPDAAAISQLGTEWSQASPLSAARLAADPALEQRIFTWVNQTESLTARLCGPPGGDDALLYQLAVNPDRSE